MKSDESISIILNSQIDMVRKANGIYMIHDNSKEFYDVVVVIATPLEQTDLEFENIRMGYYMTKEQKWWTTWSTFMNGTINATLFIVLLYIYIFFYSL